MKRFTYRCVPLPQDYGFRWCSRLGANPVVYPGTPWPQGQHFNPPPPPPPPSVPDEEYISIPLALCSCGLQPFKPPSPCLTGRFSSIWLDAPWCQFHLTFIVNVSVPRSFSRPQCHIHSAIHATLQEQPQEPDMSLSIPWRPVKRVIANRWRFNVLLTVAFNALQIMLQLSHVACIFFTSTFNATLLEHFH